MAWCAARTFHAPSCAVADFGGVLRRRSSLAAAGGIGCVSLAGSSVWRPKRSSAFSCLSMSTEAGVLKEAVKTEKAPAALGPYSQAIKAKMNQKFGKGKPPIGTPSLAASSIVVIASLLAGASVVHNIYKPDLRLPLVEDAGEAEKKP